MSNPERGVALIVEDSDVWMDFLASIAADLGYRVVMARTLAEALALAAESPPSLVLADVYLEGQDPGGLRLIERLVASPTPPRRILVTSFATHEVRRRAEAAGAVCLVKQDVSRHSVVAAVLRTGSEIGSAESAKPDTGDATLSGAGIVESWRFVFGTS